jgi:hypothetical protein
MSDNNLLDINLPMNQIIDAKIKYHATQVQFHQSQLLALERARRLFDGNEESEGFSLTKTISSFKVSQKTVRPIVEAFLRRNPGVYTTAEIYDYLKAEDRSIESQRSEWISSISSTMNALVTYGKARSYETGIGRTKKYELLSNGQEKFERSTPEEDFANVAAEVEEDLPF